jgi:peptidoglycan/xylan/chitin deacetylase (PgdA/CDA1 family)
MYQEIRFPQSIGDDMYSYLYTIAHGFRYKFVDTTTIYFRLPNNFKDYRSQSVRFFNSPHALMSSFDKDLVVRETALPRYELFRSAFSTFFRYPLRLPLYLALSSFTYLRSFFGETSEINTWEIAESSKEVRKNFSQESFRESIFVIIRRIVYTVCGFFGNFIDSKKNMVVIFCYHAAARDSWKYSIDPQVIERQIDYLMRHRTPVTLHDVVLHMKGEKRITKPSFVVTFDDGYRDVLSMRDFMMKRGITPTLFVLSDPHHANRLELATDRPLLSRDDVMMLKHSGWEIGCHSATHANFLHLDERVLEREVRGAKEVLEKELGAPVLYFAYPKGSYTEDTLREVARAQYVLALTTRDGFIDQHTSSFEVPRVSVDRTHTFLEFKGLFTAPAIQFRKFVRMLLSL